MRKNKEDTALTIERLLELARNQFTNKGYSKVNLEDVVREAGVTRGALYHHFANKQGLFRAVLETVQQEIAERVQSEAAKSDDVWEQLLLGCRGFVCAAIEERNKRIMLIDGPAVFGWEVWRAMDEQNSMRLLKEQLQLIEQQGNMQPLSVEALTHFLSGSLNESALWIAQQSNQTKSLEDTMNVITHVIHCFKC
ncbi:TetR/AcrR family transcriptional regulator [Shimazuella kribbensis]|uniref:TetR/AcrR family transcriptional regulator n=1 Tax=Shimazuella kribbensis TaxID=139808 RepID=UPI000405FD2E|nr:TetR/AcrR family transcriptional regulator [Shimazuella kribbensis]